MRKRLRDILAAWFLFALAAPASGQHLAVVSNACSLTPPSRPTAQARDVQPDVVAVFTSALRPGTRVTIGLMDNQKLTGEFLGLRDGRLLFRAVRDRSVTLEISLPAIHSIKVRNGGTLVRP